MSLKPLAPINNSLTALHKVTENLGGFFVTTYDHMCGKDGGTVTRWMILQDQNNFSLLMMV